jgi:hypothetical protein
LKIQSSLLLSLLLAMIALIPCAYGDKVMQDSVTGAEVQNAEAAMDENFLSQMLLLPQDSSERISFVIDLEEEMEVDGIGIYGTIEFNPAIQCLSDWITVEASNAATGPWAEIGAIDVGHTRPTSPDPETGGINPFTGGNGRLIPCQQTRARYLRVSGGRRFDNAIFISHIHINPPMVVHRMDPVFQGENLHPIMPMLNDNNDNRMPLNLFDGDPSTMCVFGTEVALTLDMGKPVPVKEFVFTPCKDDPWAQVKTGEVRVSSIDSPDTFDVIAAEFDTGGGQFVNVPLQESQARQYYQLILSSNTNGGAPDGTLENSIRIGEIEINLAQ